jgi:hypothetical protein
MAMSCMEPKVDPYAVAGARLVPARVSITSIIEDAR